MKLRRTDFLALVLAASVIPFLFSRYKAPELFNMMDSLRVYADAYFREGVRCPVAPAVLDHEIYGRVYTLPHLLVPHYDAAKGRSVLDALALVGLQTDMLYNQRYSGIRYSSPYQRRGKEMYRDEQRMQGVEESELAMDAYVKIAPLQAAGRIKALSQGYVSDALASGEYLNVRTDTQKEFLRVAGVTDALDVFLLDHDLRTLWVTDEVSRLLADDMEARKIRNLVNYKVSVRDSSVYVAATGATYFDEGTLFLAALSVLDGSVEWVRTAIFPAPKFQARGEVVSHFEGGVCATEQGEAEEDQFYSSNPWEVLRSFLALSEAEGAGSQRSQHGVESQIVAVGLDYAGLPVPGGEGAGEGSSGASSVSDAREARRTAGSPPLAQDGLGIVAYRSPNFIVLLDMRTGKEVASFSIGPGVALRPGPGVGEIQAYFVSDYSASKAARFDSSYFDAVKVTVSNGRIAALPEFSASLSEYSILLDKREDVAFVADPLAKPIVAPVVHTSSVFGQGSSALTDNHVIFLAPNGVIYCLSGRDGRVVWKTAVRDFVPTSKNAHMSVQRLAPGYDVVILTLLRTVLVYDAFNGRELAMVDLMDLDGLSFPDRSGSFYDDDQERLISSVIVGRLHPFENRNAIFITNGPFLDVAGVSLPSASLSDFWERLGLGLLVFLLAASVLRVSGRWRVVEKE